MVEFYQDEHPFAGMSKEDISKLMVAKSKDASIEFDKLLKTLTETINQVNPLHLISLLAQYALTEGHSSDGKRSEKNVKVHQPHIEFLQAIYLKTLVNTSNGLPPSNSAQTQAVIDILPPLFEAYSLKRLNQIENAGTVEKKAILSLQERVRVHTQSVRNWGYFQEVVDISREIYSNVNHHFKTVYSVDVSVLIDIFVYLIREYERKLTDQRSKLLSVRKQGSIEEMVNHYYEIFELPTGQQADLIKLFKTKGMDQDTSFAMIVEHSHLFVIDFSKIHLQEIENNFEIKSGDLKKISDSLSFEFGDLKDSNIEHIFLNNPVWTRPLIRVRNDEYFCAFPQVFFSFIFQTLDSLFVGDEKFIKDISKHKSDFLELQIRKILEKSFPDTEIITNYKWNVSPATQYETDLIMKFDSHLLIVEAKSGKVSREALRGAPDRLKKNIGTVLVEPAIQSQRLQTLLLTGKPPANFPFKLSEIMSINRLSISLEDFATIQSNLSDLKETNWYDNEIKFPPTMCLSEFSVIMEILDNPSSRLHYIKRRTELQDNKTYIGDELDLLGLYLDTGLDIGNAEFEKGLLVLNETSKPIDDYFIVRDKYPAAERPKQKLTQWWKDIIKRLEERSFQGWSEISTTLLNFSIENQEKAIKKFELIKANRFVNSDDTDCEDSFITAPNQESKTAIAFIAYRASQHDKRHVFAKNISGQAFDKSDKFKKCVVFGINVDLKQSYPYALVAMFQCE